MSSVPIRPISIYVTYLPHTAFMWKKMQLSSNCSRTSATRFSSFSRACIDNHTQQCLRTIPRRRLRRESHSWSIGTRTGLMIVFRSVPVHNRNNTSSKFLYLYSLTAICHDSASTCEHVGDLFSSLLWGSNKDLAGLKNVELSSPWLNALWPWSWSYIHYFCMKLDINFFPSITSRWHLRRW